MKDVSEQLILLTSSCTGGTQSFSWVNNELELLIFHFHLCHIL